jgi:hypothetical protein
MFNIIDIGGTYIKIYNSDTKIIKRIEISNKNIIDIDKIKNIIKNNIDSSTEKIYLSCQMHGFVLYDNLNNNISEFITWKEKSECNYIQKVVNNEEFKNITGLDNRNDLPINNMYNYFKKNNINNTNIYIKNISEAILDINMYKTHVTMACGTGFLDINTNKYYKKFIDYFYEVFSINLYFDEIIFEIECNGYIIINNRNIPVYSGIGDFQASLVDVKNDDLYINMATGSQMSMIVDYLSYDKITNYRPFFNNRYLKCITHIPSGRYLNIFTKLFDDLFTYNINLNDIIESNLIIDTNIFNTDISIKNINFENFTKKNIICSIFRCYLEQYVDIYNKYFSKENIKNIILSGGIPKKLFFIKDYFEYKINKNIILKSDFDDDSIFGLLKIIEN